VNGCTARKSLPAADEIFGLRAWIVLASGKDKLTDAVLSTRSCQSLRATYFAISGNIRKRKIR
jgi:hypothetical protein